MKTCTVYSTVLLLSTSLLSRVLSVRHNYILISILLTIGLIMVTNSKYGTKLLREIEKFYF